MKTTIRFIVTAAIAVTSFVAAASAQVASNPPYTLEQSVIASGGGTAADAGNVYKIESVIGQPVAGTSSTNGSYTLRSGFFTPAPFSPTAAFAKVSGRVLTADGRGIRNVSVTMTSTSGATRMAFSSSFGYFTFEDVPVGEVYILSVRAKQFQFSLNTQVISVSEDVGGISFIADPQ
ncbi:MAG: carboxypeptidase-like regulatory domain-containing protein [Acidobacteriota bacterium]|nr:carboxypeptidase-like regulatory domain-containing protein [Acidobacteriota bacterium]